MYGCVPRCRLNTYDRRAFSVASLMVWNSLLEIRLADHIFRLIFGLAKFTRELKHSAGNTAEHNKIRLTFKLYNAIQHQDSTKIT